MFLPLRFCARSLAFRHGATIISLIANMPFSSSSSTSSSTSSSSPLVVTVVTARGRQRRVALHENVYKLLVKGAQVDAASDEEAEKRIKEAVEPWIAQIMEEEGEDSVTAVSDNTATHQPTTSQEFTVVPSQEGRIKQGEKTFTVQVPKDQASQFPGFLTYAVQTFFGSSTTPKSNNHNNNNNNHTLGDDGAMASLDPTERSDDTETEIVVDGITLERSNDADEGIDRLRIVPREWVETFSDHVDQQCLFLHFRL